MKTFAEYAQEQDALLEEGKKKKKWLGKVTAEIKAKNSEGRCSNMGGPECPEGSPQFTLAKTFKKIAKKHKKEK